jgi:hypothetical protein
MRRILAALVAAFLCSCGGGSDPSPPIVLDGPYQIIERDVTHELRFTLTFDDFFRCVGNGHAGIMLHANTQGLKTGAYSGAGLVFGRFGTGHHNTRNMPNLQPVAVLETWTNGAEVDPLHVESLSPELRDGVAYPGTLSTVGGLSYSLGDYVSPKVQLHPSIDLSLSNAAYFNASGPDQACPYAIRIQTKE